MKTESQPAYTVKLSATGHALAKRLARDEGRLIKTVIERALDAYERQNGNALTAGSTHNDTRQH